MAASLCGRRRPARSSPSTCPSSRPRRAKAPSRWPPTSDDHDHDHAHALAVGRRVAATGAAPWGSPAPSSPCPFQGGPRLVRPVRCEPPGPLRGRLCPGDPRPPPPPRRLLCLPPARGSTYTVASPKAAAGQYHPLCAARCRAPWHACLALFLLRLLSPSAPPPAPPWWVGWRGALE